MSTGMPAPGGRLEPAVRELRRLEERPMNAPTEPRLLRRAILALAGVLLSAAAGLVLLGEQQAEGDAGSRADRLRQLQSDGDALLIGMVNQESGVRGYLVTGRG